MIVAFACLLALTLLILWRAERTQTRLLDHHAQASREWRAERSELLSRIQRPELLPSSADSFEFPEQPPDEWNLVGTINRDPGPETSE